MGAPIKYSYQREAILNFLKTRKDHPTAELVYQYIRETIPNISLGTIYRNLNQLADAGIILRLTSDGKTDRYDACTDPHYHFMCNCCGSVRDIDMAPMNSLISNAKKNSNLKIDSVSVMFSGLCEDCQNQVYETN